MTFFPYTDAPGGNPSYAGGPTDCIWQTLSKAAERLHLGPQTRAMCCRAASVSPASSWRSRRYTWHRTLRFMGCPRLSGPT